MRQSFEGDFANLIPENLELKITLDVSRFENERSPSSSEHLRKLIHMKLSSNIQREYLLRATGFCTMTECRIKTQNYQCELFITEMIKLVSRFRYSDKRPYIIICVTLMTFECPV